MISEKENYQSVLQGARWSVNVIATSETDQNFQLTFESYNFVN